MKKSVIPLAACVASIAAQAAADPAAKAQSGQHWTKPYNTVWTEPGTKGYDSMPAGGGNISLNVWAEKDAVVFYIGSPDSFDANELLTKLARLRIKVMPNPFASNLRQELDLESNTVLVSGRAEDGTQVALSIRADALQPVVHVEGSATQPVTVEATLELDEGWRMTATNRADGILWSRRNPSPSAHRAKMVEAWGLEAIGNLVPDPLANLTSGGLLVGAGFIPGGEGSGQHEGRNFRSATIRSQAPVTAFALRAVLRIAQDPTPEAWDAAVDQLAEATKDTQVDDRRKSEEWWREFWDRSWIVINPEAKNPDDKPWQVGRNYQLFRAMLAANTNGKFPTFFNGGHFTCGPNPDGRAWGGCKFMAQNQRHLYWPLLKSGDADLLRVGTGFYARTAELQRARVREKFGAEGVIYDESLNTLGLGCFPNKDGFNNYKHLRYHFTSGMEFVFMMLEAHRFFGEDLTPHLPAIEGALRFFDSFYRKENKARTGSELDAEGRLVIYPGNALELYEDTRNATDALSGLMAISDGLLALPSGAIPAESRAWVEAFRKTLPPIATRQLRGHTVIAPAASWGHEGSQGNAELPQLYPVFPFRVYGVGKPDLQLARDTWWYGGRDESLKTVYCWFQGNIFVAGLGLTEEARLYALSKFLFPKDFGITHNPWKTPIAPPDTRYPAFWDAPKSFCEIPDMDHGGSAMVGLQEMLLQTDGKKILLLPAWPKDWDVDFKLHAPDQTTVEARFRKGKIDKLVVTPASRTADVIDLSGVEPPPLPPKPLNPKDGLCVGKTATASSIYSEDYGPANAVDGNLQTRWAAKQGTTDAWLEVDLGQPTLIGRALISEITWKETREFVLEARDGETWKELARGTTIGSDFQLEFPAIKTRFVRLRIVKSERAANINEFQVFPPQPITSMKTQSLGSPCRPTLLTPLPTL